MVRDYLGGVWGLVGVGRRFWPGWSRSVKAFASGVAVSVCAGEVR